MGFPLLHKFKSNNNREGAVAAQLLLLCSLFLASPTSIGAQEPQQQQLPRPPPQFLTAADFRLAALDQQQEQPVTFLTELDFNNAQKYKDLLEVKARRRSNILTQQRFYRGDIRGKAAWRRERHQRLQDQELRRRDASGSNGGQKRRSSSRRYNGVANVVKKWPNGRIPYVLSTDYSERERAVLARAFQEYHSRTCIRFVPKSPFDHDFLYVGKIDGCYSDVGRAGGKQELSLDDGCLHVDTVIHELMHSVGFYHEHERWDRDNFLVILWQNIDRDAYDQFGRVDLLESSFYGQNYDYTSIMHYDSLAFSRNGRETLVAREPAMTAVIGSATDFSPVDLAKIHKMYQCMEIDAASPLPPSPSSPAIQQSLEFTGDNSILGGGAGTVGEIAIAAAAGIPRLLPPSSPQSFRMPGMTSAQLPAQLLPSGPVLLALGGGRPMPLESQQPLARPRNQQQLQHLQQPHFAAFRPMAAGTPIQQSPQGIPLYLRVNSLASSGSKEEGPSVGENGSSSSRQPDSNGLGNKKELGNAMTEAHSPPTMASSSAQMSSGSLLPMVVIPPAVRKQQRICEDRLGLCPLWLPYCRMAFYGQLMRQFCARSCDFCGDDSNINNSNDAANIRHFSMRKQQRAFPVLVNAQKRRRKRR